MTKPELIRRLEMLAISGDKEAAHVEADNALIEFINDDEVKSAYDGITKRYA
jgi:hypothetical protein